jgi:hypothetical protein
VVGEDPLDAVVVEHQPQVGVGVVEDGRGGAEVVVERERVAARVLAEQVHLGALQR